MNLLKIDQSIEFYTYCDKTFNIFVKFNNKSDI